MEHSLTVTCLTHEIVMLKPVEWQVIQCSEMMYSNRSCKSVQLVTTIVCVLHTMMCQLCNNFFKVLVWWW